MAALAGVNASVASGANTIANMMEWSLDLGGDTQDVTPFLTPTGWRVHLGTVKKWTAKCHGFLDITDTTGQVALNNGLLSTFTMKFNINTVPNGWSGSAILTAIVPKVSATGVVDLEYSFQGTGPCTYA